jgi:hypothetical protein
MGIQLDLFLDSRAVVLANEAASAIAIRDLARAAHCVAELRSAEPDYPALQPLDVLVSAVAEWERPAREPARIAAALTRLERVIAPAASQAMGPASQALLTALFHDLAEAARGLPYDPAWAAAHCAPLSLYCGEWAMAEQAALAIPDACDIPDALHWLTVARYRQHGLAAARPALFALAWRDPQRLPSVLAELGDELLDRDLKAFESACEWTGTEAAELYAWFPAWYVLEHPVASKELEDIEVRCRSSAAKAALLLTRILDAERQADWRKLVAFREQLRSLSADLFSVYMMRRAVRYSR